MPLTVIIANDRSVGLTTVDILCNKESDDDAKPSPLTEDRRKYLGHRNLNFGGKTAMQRLSNTLWGRRRSSSSSSGTNNDDEDQRVEELLDNLSFSPPATPTPPPQTQKVKSVVVKKSSGQARQAGILPGYVTSCYNSCPFDGTTDELTSMIAKGTKEFTLTVNCDDDVVEALKIRHCQWPWCGVNK